MIDGETTFVGVLLWLDYAGVAVFAISGALVASRKRMDPGGFALIATVTGIGGGTLRDLLLDRDVFWIGSPEYIGLCAACSLLVFLTAPRIEHRYPVLLWADAVGLGLFAMLGARITLGSGFHPLIAVVMGVMTATFGGMIRDVMCRETPLILRNEIYATAALAGGIVYVALKPLALPFWLPECLSVLAGFGARAIGLLGGVTLPRYRARPGRDYPPEREIPTVRAARRRQEPPDD